MPRSPVVWFVPYVAASIVHLGTLAIPVEWAETPTKALLMPLLAVAFYGLARHAFGQPAHHGRLRLVLVAVFFSWLGDLALNAGDGETWFLTGVGMFLVAQLAYIVVFRRLGDSGVTSSRRWLVVPYAVWWLGLVVYFVTATGADPLLVAVGVYGIALGAMAYLAHRINGVAAIGAALFLISDTFIGLSGFADVNLPGQNLWVMATYTIGQGLIIAGLLRHGAVTVSGPQGPRSGLAGTRADSDHRERPPA